MSESKGSYLKILGIGLIPIIIILTGTIFGIFLMGNELTVNVNDEYITDLSVNLNEETQYTVRQLNSFFNDISEFSEGMYSTLYRVFVENKTTSQINFPYYAGTFFGEFSEKFNQTVDFTTSSFKVFAENRNSAVNDTIKKSPRLDLYIPSYYSSYQEFLFVEMIYDVGVHQMYPHGLQNDITKDPRNTNLYNESRDSKDLVVSKPYVYKGTNDIALNFSKGISIGSTFIGVLNIAFLFQDQIDFIYNGVQRDTMRVMLIDDSMKYITHTSIDHEVNNWNPDLLNYTLYEFEKGTSEFNDTISKALNGYSSNIVVENDRLMTVIPLESKDMIFIAIIDYPASQVYGEFVILDLLAIPITFIVFFGLIVFGILRKYGMLKGVDLVKLASTDIIGAVMDNIPTSTEDLMNVVTDKIDEIGEKGVAAAEKLTQDVIDGGLDKVEEKILSKIDTVIDDGIEKLDSFEKDMIAKRDAFAETVLAKAEASYRNFEKMGVDFDEILNGDFTSLTKVAADSKRLEIILAKAESIDLNKMADVVKRDPTELKTWIEMIPPEYGILVDRLNIVHINHTKVMQHLPKVIASYTGIDLTEVNTDQLLKGDFSSIEGVTDDAIAFGKLMNEVDQIELSELATKTGQDQNQLEQWVTQLPPDLGLKLDEGVVYFDQDKIKQNLPSIIKSYLKI